MQISDVLWMAAGLVSLMLGAEGLVRGASRLARSFGVPPLVIGLTVVAIGTSAPELAVSIRAAIADTPAVDLALGNVVGSNIFNTLLILGVAALIRPLHVQIDLIRSQVLLMIAVSVVVLLLSLNGTIGRLEGFGLCAVAFGHTVYTLLSARGGRNAVHESENNETLAADTGSAWQARSMDMILIVGGVAALVIGSTLLVSGAVSLARFLGISELFIGLTVVAAGTSLPELATSVWAGIRGERDIAVGNVVGSNIFNLLAVLGVASALSQNGISISDLALRFDIPVMVTAAVACFPIFLTGHKIDRFEGAVFVGVFALYMVTRALAATGNVAAGSLYSVIIAIILPLLIWSAISVRRDASKRY